MFGRIAVICRSAENLHGFTDVIQGFVGLKQVADAVFDNGGRVGSRFRRGVRRRRIVMARG